MIPCVIIEVIPTVAIQNNKNSAICSVWGYRAQAVVLFEWAVALLATALGVLLVVKLADAPDLPDTVLPAKLVLVPVVPALPVVAAGPVADPLLQVGQLYVLDALLENGVVLD